MNKHSCGAPPPYVFSAGKGTPICNPASPVVARSADFFLVLVDFPGGLESPEKEVSASRNNPDLPIANRRSIVRRR